MKNAKFGISIGMGFKMPIEEQIEAIGREEEKAWDAFYKNGFHL